MAYQVDGKELLLGRGKTYFKRFEAAGTASGLVPLGQVTQLEIRPQSESIEERDMTAAQAGILAQVNVSTDHQVVLTLKQMNAHNVALALMGTVGAYTQAATAVTDESHIDVKQGAYIKTAKRQIGSVVITGAGGTPTYATPADYVIEDAAEGLIRIVPGGAIADGTDILVDYTPTAVSAPGLATVAGGVSAFIEGELLFIPDPGKGPKWRGEFWKVSLNSSAVLALIQSGNEFAGAELTGRLLSDAVNHPNDPYYKLTLVGTV